MTDRPAVGTVGAWLETWRAFVDAGLDFLAYDEDDTDELEDED